MRRGPAAPGFEPPPKAVAAYHFRVRRLVAQPKAVVHHAPAAAMGLVRTASRVLGVPTSDRPRAIRSSVSHARMSANHSEGDGGGGGATTTAGAAVAFRVELPATGAGAVVVGLSGGGFWKPAPPGSSASVVVGGGFGGK